MVQKPEEERHGITTLLLRMFDHLSAKEQKGEKHERMDKLDVAHSPDDEIDHKQPNCNPHGIVAPIQCNRLIFALISKGAKFINPVAVGGVSLVIQFRATGIKAVMHRSTDTKEFAFDFLEE